MKILWPYIQITIALVIQKCYHVVKGGDESLKKENGFGKRLKIARINKGITQLELAEQSGVSLGTIRNCEQGNNNASLASTIVKFSEILEVTTDHLLKGE